MKNPSMSFSRAALVALAVAAFAVNAHGQAQAQPDFSKVEIKTTKLSDNLYTLEGKGGTISVLAGPDGVLLVDDQFAPLSGKIVTAIKQISDSPIRFVVNTHVHGDHTGGNENFAKLGAVIFARDELRERLAHPSRAANGTQPPPAPPAALPVVTYEGRLKFHLNGEEVELIPIPRAHTDGDTLVYFHNADVLSAGDFYRSIQYPNIDRTNGGSLSGLLDGLGVLIGLAGPNTKIVPGHGPVVSRVEVIAHRDMILAVRDRVAQLIAQGKSQDEVLAAHPTSEFDARIPNSKETTERFVKQLYAELQPGELKAAK